MEVTSHHFCCFALIRTSSLHAAHTQAEDNYTWTGIQGGEVTEGQLRTLPTIGVNKNTHRSSIGENRDKKFQSHVLKKNFLGHSIHLD